MEKIILINNKKVKSQNFKEQLKYQNFNNFYKFKVINMYTIYKKIKTVRLKINNIHKNHLKKIIKMINLDFKKEASNYHN
jgi:hypothetical protein